MLATTLSLDARARTSSIDAFGNHWKERVDLVDFMQQDITRDWVIVIPATHFGNAVQKIHRFGRDASSDVNNWSWHVRLAFHANDAADGVDNRQISYLSNSGLHRGFFRFMCHEDNLRSRHAR